MPALNPKRNLNLSNQREIFWLFFFSQIKFLKIPYFFMRAMWLRQHLWVLFGPDKRLNTHPAHINTSIKAYSRPGYFERLVVAIQVYWIWRIVLKILYYSSQVLHQELTNWQTIFLILSHNTNIHCYCPVWLQCCTLPFKHHLHLLFLLNWMCVYVYVCVRVCV